MTEQKQGGMLEKMALDVSAALLQEFAKLLTSGEQTTRPPVSRPRADC